MHWRTRCPCLECVVSFQSAPKLVTMETLAHFFMATSNDPYVDLSDPVYREIEERIRATYPNSCIVWMERLLNPHLENEFKMYQSTIKPPNVKTLFHGTSEEIARIIMREGFDPSKNKASMYGKGVYFATTAAYSKNYMHRTESQDFCFMLFCDVVTGRVGQGIAGTPFSAQDFDSVADRPAQPSIYVVNRREAALPKYLVAFSPGIQKPEADNRVKRYKSSQPRNMSKRRKV